MYIYVYLFIYSYLVLYTYNFFRPTELSFLHLCSLPKIPEVTDNSPSDGG